MNDMKREDIKNRVEAAQAREEAKTPTLTERATETASDAADGFTTFVKEHPFAAAAGGVALGVLVAGLFRGPRQAAARGGAKAVGLAAVGAEIASGFASHLLDDASDMGREGARRANDLTDRTGDKARSFGRSASHKRSEEHTSELQSPR